MTTSSINYSVAESVGELRDAVILLREWLSKHEHLSYFTFDMVSRDLSDQVSTEHLNRVLLRLENAGELSAALRVKIDEGMYSGESFTTMAEKPEYVTDPMLRKVASSHLRVVSAYAPARAE